MNSFCDVFVLFFVSLILVVNDVFVYIKYKLKSEILKILDEQIQRKFLKLLIQTNYLDSVYMKHVEMKLKIIQLEKRMSQKIKESENKIKIWINESEKDTYIALEHFLNDTIHVACYAPHISEIQIRMSDDAINLGMFHDWGDKNCFFEFILYDFNDKIVDEFDIDFGFLYYGNYGNYVDDIMNLTNFKNNLTMKDARKKIFSNNKNNHLLFASNGHMYIFLSQKTYLKKIIINTKDTVVGTKQDHRGYVDAKPKKFWVRLLSLQDEKMKILQEFDAKCNDDYTCVIHNYEAYKLTGNPIRPLF